jgi:hypothetical protein
MIGDTLTVTNDGEHAEKGRSFHHFAVG